MVDISDIFHDDEHDLLKIEPKLQKDVDRLSAMFSALGEAAHEGIDHTKIAPVCSHKTSQQSIAPGVTMVSIQHGNFRGLKICVACCRRAAMFYGDAARIMEEICDAAENHPEKEKL